ncbi:MFS general substrate transporter [Trametes coccinea BRFM310]|uniref:MFS general substrate transporter n=1 Tax=Trametes coccinea (strain BRFM310) TaxID=1353009 RepID=A0A1Y2IGN1_TRAC3|nr:MFS general substrate transporter [Trametes coccinea BRFM310]
MSGLRLPSTVLGLLERRRGLQESASSSASASVVQPPHEADESGQEPAVNDDLKLPKMGSLAIIITSNVMLQLTFFIIVSSSNEYAQYLGGTSTFSGLVIGIPTVFSGIALLPLMRLDQGGYKRPLHFACASAVLGNVLYGLAYHAHWLYLILLGRIVTGFAFTFWMYNKRYCSDPRIVGLRRRTTLAGWLVLGQGIGFSLGPFVGGLLYKVGFNNSVFNGFTSPAWIMAALWAVFWVVAAFVYEDVPKAQPASQSIPLQPISAQGTISAEEDAKEDGSSGVTTAEVSETGDSQPPPIFRMNKRQWGVTVTMCWFAMTCFHILGAWEANIPVFTSSHLRSNPFHFTPFAAGNMIALGGACTIPFLLLNLHFARRVQDRHTLAMGTSIGLTGLIIALAILGEEEVNYGSLFICWFLVALGFNIASTVTLSLLSKQLPGEWNGRVSLAIQYSNYTGRVTGAVWGGAGVKVGMLSYVGMQVAFVGIGYIMFVTLWKQLKAKTG